MSLWPGRPLFGYKNGPVATPAALQIVAGNISSASNRPKMQSCEVKGPEDTFIAHMMLKSWNHKFSPGKTNKSWWS